MITIRYKPVIINGVDKSGKVETLPDAEGLHLISRGYAEIVQETAAPDTAVISQDTKKRKKGWRLNKQ
jgi:hypothetical protein